jgi:hypothetical protein
LFGVTGVATIVISTDSPEDEQKEVNRVQALFPEATVLCAHSDESRRAFGN